MYDSTLLIENSKYNYIDILIHQKRDITVGWNRLVFLGRVFGFRQVEEISHSGTGNSMRKIPDRVLKFFSRVSRAMLRD